MFRQLAEHMARKVVLRQQLVLLQIRVRMFAVLVMQHYLDSMPVPKTPRIQLFLLFLPDPEAFHLH